MLMEVGYIATLFLILSFYCRRCLFLNRNCKSLEYCRLFLNFNKHHDSRTTIVATPGNGFSGILSIFALYVLNPAKTTLFFYNFGFDKKKYQFHTAVDVIYLSPSRVRWPAAKRLDQYECISRFQTHMLANMYVFMCVKGL